MKTIIINIFLLFNLDTYSQEIKLTTALCDYSNKCKVDSILLDSAYIFYKLVAISETVYTNRTEKSGDVIIINYPDTISVKSENNLMKSILTQNKLVEINVFKTCMAIDIHYSSLRLTANRSKYYNENFIGEYKLN